jgi:hypothetical protein
MHNLSRKRPLLALTGAALLLASCVGYVGAGYDGYYDDYYGPYVSGYWANDGFFWYLNQQRQYLRDNGQHFRRGTFPGGHPFHGEHRGQGDRGAPGRPDDGHGGHGH